MLHPWAFALNVYWLLPGPLTEIDVRGNLAPITCNCLWLEHESHRVDPAVRQALSAVIHIYTYIYIEWESIYIDYMWSCFTFLTEFFFCYSAHCPGRCFGCQRNCCHKCVQVFMRIFVLRRAAFISHTAKSVRLPSSQDAQEALQLLLLLRQLAKRM